MRGIGGEVPGVRRRVVFDRADQTTAMWEAYHRESRRGRSFRGCVACPPQRRDPNALLQSHHVIDQQRIREIALDRGWSALHLLKVLTDKRNSMLVCEDHHHGHTSRMRPITRDRLSREAWEFARDNDLIDEVLDTYPPPEGGEHGDL